MNTNENLSECQSQNAKILAWLKSGNTITSLAALKMFGCFRLASRINDLQKRGHEIKRKYITTSESKRVKMYWIESTTI